MAKRRGGVGDANDDIWRGGEAGGKTWSNKKKLPGAGRTHLAGRQSPPSSVRRASLMRGLV